MHEKHINTYKLVRVVKLEKCPSRRKVIALLDSLRVFIEGNLSPLCTASGTY